MARHFVQRHARRLLVACMLLLAVLVAAWLIARLRTPAERVVLAQRAAPAEAPDAAVPTKPPEAGWAVPVAPHQAKSDEAEVCGVGVLDLRGMMDFFLNESSYTRTVQALLVWLAANPDPQAHATGLYLQSHEAIWNRDNRQQMADDVACASVPDTATSEQVPPACQLARERANQREQAMQAKAVAPAMQLAQLARRSGDPKVLALAHANCHSMGDAPGIAACQQGLLLQWASVEPDNAAPWLNLMSDAQTAKSDSAMADALYHLSLAKYERTHAGMMVPWIARNRPAEQRDGDDQRLLELAAGTLSMATLPSYSGLMRSCLPAERQDANRRQLCGAIAEVLVGKPDSLIGLRIGYRLGQGLGWSPERLARLDTEHQGLRQANASLYDDQQMNSPSCDGQDRLYRYLRLMGQEGEVGSMRQLVGTSGKSLDQLAQEGQRREAAQKATAVSAALAASQAASQAAVIRTAP